MYKNHFSKLRTNKNWEVNSFRADNLVSFSNFIGINEHCNRIRSFLQIYGCNTLNALGNMRKLITFVHFVLFYLKRLLLLFLSINYDKCTAGYQQLDVNNLWQGEIHNLFI